MSMKETVTNLNKEVTFVDIFLPRVYISHTCNDNRDR